MKPIAKFYLRVFLGSAIPFAILLGLFEWASKDSHAGFVGVVMQAVLFGFIMSIILGSLQLYNLRRYGPDELTDSVLDTHQAASLKGRLNVTELVELLRDDTRFDKMAIRVNGNQISISVPANWKSWGEQILIDVISDEGYEYYYEIKSSPKLKTTLIDYGKNFQNIKMIKEVISNENAYV